MYLELYNGKNSPDEELDDWGFEGPIIGPVDTVQLTYLFHIKLQHSRNNNWQMFDLIGDKDMIEFNGKFYGDMLVISKVPKKERHRLVSIEKLIKEEQKKKAV